MKKITITLAFLISIISINAQFGPQQILPTGYNDPQEINTYDLDNDGDLDILLCCKEDWKVIWYENLGSNNFSSPILISSLPGRAMSASAADLDNDGDLDIITVASWTSDELSWHENLGGGIFGAKNIINNTQGGSTKVRIADLDNDNDLDIVLDATGTQIHYYENLGSTTFSSRLEFNPGLIYSLAFDIADIDNDGDNDILIADVSDQLVWLENLGGLNFGTVQFLVSTLGSSTFGQISDLVTTDLDNDGDLDALCSDLTENVITWHENISPGNFGPKQIINNILVSPFSVQSADFDSDGDMDILSASRNDFKIAWYENLGSGNFGVQQIISDSASDLISINVGDLDGDGDFEVVGNSSLNGQIAWYENFIQSPYQLKGKAYYDENQNGTNDSNDINLSFFQFNISPSNAASFSDSGNYSFSTDSGTHIVSFINDSLWNLTSDSSTYTRSVNGINPIVDSLDFGFYPDPVNSITIIRPELIGGFPRCNQIINYWINIINDGTSLSNGVIELKLNDSISFVNSLIAPDSMIGQNYYWHFDSLFFNESQMFNLQVQMPSFINMGDTLSSILSVYELDINNNILYNNTDTLNQVLVCAYDPNDKNVTPRGIDPEGYIIQEQKLEYLIRFQNTGNDTAITVIIRDQLDTNLDWSTLQPLASSHPMQIWIEQDGEAVFKFENIFLPDSNVNESGSHGFVKFSINPKSNLQSSVSIFNTGHIYFDQNPPVVTNTIRNTIYDCNTPIQYSTTNLTICQNDSISGNVADNISTSIFLWDIPGIYSASGSNFNWLADTSGSFNLTISSLNSLCNKDTTINIIVPHIIPVVNQNNSICQGDSIMVYGNYQSIAGVYYDSLQTINGCDSIFSTTLTINPLPTVSLANFNPDTLCVNANAVTLPTGSPSGGNYSGNGVIGGNFDPTTSGVGLHDVIYTYTDGNSCINSDTTIVTVDVCTGIDNESTDFGIIIYPNPSTGQFTIEKPNDLSKEVQIKLLDATSKLILEKVIPIGKRKIEMDIRNYSKGIYYLQLIVDDEIFIKQILKN